MLGVSASPAPSPGSCAACLRQGRRESAGRLRGPRSACSCQLASEKPFTAPQDTVRTASRFMSMGAAKLTAFCMSSLRRTSDLPEPPVNKTHLFVLKL